ncbi:MAG: DUF1295 domain-containing protein [Acidobacteria bacterium]|nr:DUF1295 domain-containing protein [Acidobacteriota bacterium]MYJ04754.1 DUF1295 domain-containing protein [Acidobacteriota bacterium]
MLEQLAEVGLPGLAAALGLTFLVWLLSLARSDASIVDIFWGLGFVVLAWSYRALGEADSIRSALAPALVTIWGVRLSAYILWRNHGRGEDPRYAAMRRRWGPRFPLLSLPIVFWLQAVLMWIVAMPLLQVQTADAAWSWLDSLGVALFLTGFAFEAIGDRQLARFRADPANAGQVMDQGLWRYTRHPNYFGDATLWWGFGCLALATPGGAWALVGPALMTVLILRVSGVSLLEEGLRKRRPAYRDYIERTNAFLPWRPREPRPGRD